MKSRLITFLFVFVAYVAAVAQHTLSITLTVNKALQAEVNEEGRLFIFFTQDSVAEPRTRTWPSPGNALFAKNLKVFNARKPMKLASDGWVKTPLWDLKTVPAGEYFVQILWDQDTNESSPNAPGNIYSEKQKVIVKANADLMFELSRKIPPHEVVKHELVREVDLVSESLSKWWGHPVHVKATVLLPAGYKEGDKKQYPIRYNVSGYGGRYYRINRLVDGKSRRERDFMDWWASADAPRIINVFLDGEGPYGDSYQLDSDNSGPYGYSLVHELIPYIEKKYRGTESAATRFVDGCSTGGWVSLGLQLYYPDVFNGAFSYSPDAVEFENYQLINIYKDQNAFINETGYLRPVMRDVTGEPLLSLQDFIQYENVLGSSNTYVTSGGQFSAHTALYSPKGKDGLPKPLFDPITGEIDATVAESWKKYDFKLYAQKNWKELGPKLQGKVYVWMGDMDNFYLNTGTRAFDKFLKTTKDPVSDAEIIFEPMQGHCAIFSNKRVLLQIAERLKGLGKSSN